MQAINPRRASKTANKTEQQIRYIITDDLFPKRRPSLLQEPNGCQIRRRALGPKHIMECLNRKCSLQQNHILRLLIRTRFLTFGFVVSVITVFVGSITVEKYLLFLAVARAALFMVCNIFISMIEHGGC